MERIEDAERLDNIEIMARWIYDYLRYSDEMLYMGVYGDRVAIDGILDLKAFARVILEDFNARGHEREAA